MIYVGNKARPREKKSALSVERVRELLNYDSQTGAFTRRLRNSQGTQAGELAGSADIHGRVRICIDGRLYFAHRLAWLHVTGHWPAQKIDHRDGNPANNAFANLRDVPQRTNSENQRKPRSDNSTGLLGVTRSGKRYRAGIQVNGKKKQLGSFCTSEAAHRAYLDAKRNMHEGNTL